MDNTPSLLKLKHLTNSEINISETLHFYKQFAQPFKELMTYYSCAMMEVETKFRVLDHELSLQYDRNPIESVKTRLKSPESIIEKMIRRGYPLDVDSLETNINDIAGVRVICSFTSDLYSLAESLLAQDDIQLIEKKDYIKSPKPNGYRSLHLIIQIPIFLHDTKKLMRVEVQFRTIAMDLWASLEHKLRYKKNIPHSDFIETELRECANIGSVLDTRMERLKQYALNQ